MFSFKLVHVPGRTFHGPDGLSRRRRGEEEEDEDEQGAEDWVEDLLTCGVWIASGIKEAGETRDVCALTRKGAEPTIDGDIPSTEKGREREEELKEIQRFLETLQLPGDVTHAKRDLFIKKTSKFFYRGGKLWRQERNGRHQIVLFGKDRLETLTATHDSIGHKGFYTTRKILTDRFWWPFLDDAVHWFINTCHICQLLSTQKVVIPPTMTTPATLFHKCHVDTMHLPKSGGYKYLVQARCSLTGWPEYQSLQKENGKSIAKFLFNEILCRWG
ncbi:hypothetical protein BYT27DRAFT_7079253, partial [Phlegmacium glaucopus]